MFIDTDNYQYRLAKEAPNLFTYRFNNVQKDVEFFLFSGGVESESYTLDVLKKNPMWALTSELDYPVYTQRGMKFSRYRRPVVPVSTNIGGFSIP